MRMKKKSMSDYIKMVAFYFLEALGAFCNFLCSLLHYYPKCDWGVSFLIFLQEKIVKSEAQKSEKKRSRYEQKASSKKKQAFDDDEQVQ